MFYFKWASSTMFGLMYLEKYNSVWDKTLKTLIELHGDTAKLDGCTLKLGGHEIWIANEYYSYGHLYSYNRGDKSHRPSVSTMAKLDKIVQRIKAERQSEREKAALERYSKVKG